MAKIGDCSGTSPKTLTYKQHVEKGNKVPSASLVQLIFKPHKFPNFTLIVEAGFKVLIPTDSDLGETLMSSLSYFSEQQYALFICDLNPDDGFQFGLEQRDDWLIGWTETEWGYRCENLTKRTPTASVKSSRKRKQDGIAHSSTVRQLALEGIDDLLSPLDPPLT
jgi:hypothetical protein